MYEKSLDNGENTKSEKLFELVKNQCGKHSISRMAKIFNLHKTTISRWLNPRTKKQKSDPINCWLQVQKDPGEIEGPCYFCEFEKYKEEQEEQEQKVIRKNIGYFLTPQERCSPFFSKKIPSFTPSCIIGQLSSLLSGFKT